MERKPGKEFVMGVKIVVKPSISYADDVELYQVTRVIEHSDKSQESQFLWFTDLLYHNDIADPRWDLFDEEEPLTWAALFMSETEAQECIEASMGKVHVPVITTSRHGNWHIKRRLPCEGSKKGTKVLYL